MMQNSMMNSTRRWGGGAAVLVGLIVGGGFSSNANAQIDFANRTADAGLTAAHSPAEGGFTGGQEKMTSGLGVGDFNRDGFQDFLWIGGGDVADKLFINNGDGTFTDEAAAWGIGDLHCGNAVAVGDYNNDGWLDMYVGSFGGPDDFDGLVGMNRLYRNNGDNSFTDVAVEAGVNQPHDTKPGIWGAAWGDYDLDGDLDLFASMWFPSGGEDTGNVLFRNNGDGTFTNVRTEAFGAQLDNTHGFAPAFVDMNEDLYPEILLAADFLSSKYLVNDGDGTFTNLAPGNGTAEDENGMGQTVGDFNNDGELDWYVSSIWSETADPPKTGNKLYMNSGSDTYVELAEEWNAHLGNWGWGTIAVDLDHDGFEDILEINGWDGMQDDPPGRLFYNHGNSLMTDIGPLCGFDTVGQGRGMAILDTDNDGDMDVLVHNNGMDIFPGQEFEYFRNETKKIGKWLRLKFDTSGHDLLAPDGFGTRVTVTAGPKQLESTRYVNGSPTFLSTSEIGAHVGLRHNPDPISIHVIWARGQETLLTDVEANQLLVIVAPHPADVDGDGTVGTTDLLQILGAWGPVEDSSDLKYDLDNDGFVSTTDLIAMLGAWGA